jgi:multiple sugar transport system ATP-binding protein
MGKIQFKNVNKIYPNGFHAIHDFNLTIDEGEFIVFVGPSGCGKSTVLRMLGGLEQISSGEVILDGKVVNKCPPVERDIAIVFQDYALYSNMSVYENVGISMKVQHEKDTVILDKVLEAADTVEITEYLNRLPKQLSGGQKQRIAIVRSLAMNPKVMLFDEPTSALDPEMVGAGPCHCPQAESVSDGRTLVEPGCQAAKFHPNRDCTAAAAPWSDNHLCYP